MPAKKKAPEPVPVLASKVRVGSRQRKAKRRVLRVLLAPVATQEAGVQTKSQSEALDELIARNQNRFEETDTDASRMLSRVFQIKDKDVSARTQVLLGFGAPMRLTQCETCFESNAHSCLEATGLDLARKVFAPSEGGRSICLLCFSEFDDRMHMLGHYLVHTPENLAQIGVSEQLVLKYINEQYPRLRDEEHTETTLENGTWFMSELLAANAEKQDALTGFLVRTLPDATRASFSMLCMDDYHFPYGVSEPNHWIFTLNKEIAPRNQPARLSVDCVKTEFDFEYGDRFRPIALIADGTFQPQIRREDRQAYEIAAMLALIASGVWKRHAATHGENYGKQLEYVGWHAVRQQLQDDGRGPLAELFDAFFKNGRYEEKLDKLLKKIHKKDWGFTSDWERVRKPQPPPQEQQQAQKENKE